MVQVALGPDASGESVRHTALHLTLVGHQNNGVQTGVERFFLDHVLDFGGLCHRYKATWWRFLQSPSLPQRK